MEVGFGREMLRISFLCKESPKRCLKKRNERQYEEKIIFDKGKEKNEKKNNKNWMKMMAKRRIG